MPRLQSGGEQTFIEHHLADARRPTRAFSWVAVAAVLAVLAASPLAGAGVPAHPKRTEGHGASQARLTAHGIKEAGKAHAKDKNRPKDKGQAHPKKGQADSQDKGPAKDRAQAKDKAQAKDRNHPKDKGHAKDKSHAKDNRRRPHSVVHGPNYNPPYADIVVDVNSGEVLHATDPDNPRHPASLTKIMTLYLLFEQLDAKKLGLGSRLPISAFAASQAPTKLGLKPNDTIAVEDAIKGLVTRSANDAAVVIAEAIGGTEVDFAALMTKKAQALGMLNTVYVNASGLPADAQLTTARDQALLGRAIQDRFPEYYRYFGLPSFLWHGKPINNHNALLRDMPGVDGIKTGYTEASGYNLVCSLRREGRHLVAVVLGGRSNATRNARMRQLLDEHLRLAAPIRTAPPIAPAATPSLPVGVPAEARPAKPATPHPSPGPFENAL